MQRSRILANLVGRAAFTAFWVKMHSHGFAIGLIFFGFTCMVRGYLIVKSGFLPAFLGFLLTAADVCYISNSFLLLLAPHLAGLFFPWILLPCLVGELAITLWFLFRGLDINLWKARVISMK